MATRSARREALTGALVCLVLFGVLALLATRARGGLTYLDRVLGRAPYRFAGEHPAVLRVAEVVEWLSAPDHVVLAGLAAGLLFLLAGSGRRAALIAGVPVLADRLYPLIKQAVGRPRPGHVDPLHTIGGLSFPSGHATVFGALAWTTMALVAALVADPVRRRRWYAVIGAAVVTVGLDRLMLGVHWFSDVLAGLLLAGAIALAAVATLDPYRRADPGAGIKSVRDRLTPSTRRTAVVDAGDRVLVRAGDGAGHRPAGLGPRPRR